MSDDKIYFVNVSQLDAMMRWGHTGSHGQSGPGGLEVGSSHTHTHIFFGARFGFAAVVDPLKVFLELVHTVIVSTVGVKE